MNTNYIKCPKCNHKIPLNEAMIAQVQEELEKTYEIKLAQELKKQEDKLEARREKEQEEEYQRMRKDLIKKAKREYDSQLKEHEVELAERDKEISKIRKEEKVFQLQKMEWEKKQHQDEIKYLKKLETERTKIHSEVETETKEKYSLELREKEKVISDLKKQMEEATKKADQGSMQLQGEVLEQELEDLLKTHFPEDEIIPVKTGQRGGDIIQVVKTRNGNVVGKILWEAKRTKHWSSSWVKKLKEDMQRDKCDLGSIVSEALPEAITDFAMFEGVWVTDRRLAMGLAVALRQNLQNSYTLKVAIESQSGKKELVYNYLTGNQFKGRIEAIVETFRDMRDDLDAEKRTFERIWGKRDKQIEIFVKNISGMYGDLQGLGASLETVKLLELPQIEE